MKSRNEHPKIVNATEKIILIQEINSLCENENYEQALKKCTKAMKKYSDLCITIMYCEICIKLNQNLERAKRLLEKMLFQGLKKESALKLLSEIEFIFNNDELVVKYCQELIKYTKNRSLINGSIYTLAEVYKRNDDLITSASYFEKLLNTTYECTAIMNLLCINIELKEYEEALKYVYLCLNKKISLKSAETFKILFFLKSKLGLIEENYKPKDYFEKQTLDYSSKRAYNHISTHLKENDLKARHTIFVQNIDLKNLFENCIEQLSVIEPVSDLIVDRYYISFDNIIGISNETETNIVEVITVNGTKNILTMFPVINKNILNHTKQKKLS